MPSYPTPSAYQEAIQFPEDAFHDPALQQAYPDENVLGLPQPITGNFAAVFPMNAPRGPRWAVKCFLTDVPDQQARYAAIADHLAETDRAHTVAFEYQPEGIQVEEHRYPILKMAWAEGIPLNRFVADHLDAPDTLRRLTEVWADMLQALDEDQIAHGDLQHGNVLVQPLDDDLRLTLVDYDAMVVPGLDRGTHPEVGHRNYQHPDRTERDVGLYLDRFPGLVIATALRACIARPDLWDRFDTGENLLFRDADFFDPSASILFDTLSDIESIRPWVEALRTACYVEPESVPTLATVRAGEVERSAWYETRPAVARRSRARRRTSRTGWARWFLPGAAAGGVILAGLVLAGWPWAATAWLGLALVGAGWGTRSAYRELSIVRRRHRLEREEARLDRLIRSLERQVASLQTKRKAVHNTVDDRRAQRLAEARDEALYDKLKHHFIGEVAGVDGVTHKHVVRLKKAGIRTAYEADPDRLQALRTLGDQTTTRIAMWRAALVTKYDDALPESLSPAEERRIHRYIERRIDSIDAEIARAREKIRVQQTERTQIRARKDDIPPLSVGRYLRYLLHLDTLPAAARATSTGAPSEAGQQQGGKVVPADDPSDRPWWVRSV